MTHFTLRAVLVLAAALAMSCDTTSAAQRQEPRLGTAATPGEPAAEVGVSRYPAEVIGQWEPGPNPCRLPLTYDSDSGFRIESALLQGYEHTNTPKRVQVISKVPLAWRIESMEEHYEDQDAVTDIFVLSGEYLTVTDGQRSTTYRKCYPD